MLEYKVLCSNFPPDMTDLNRFAQENWELAGICTLQPGDDIAHHLEGVPANSDKANMVRYVWYFKRIA